MPSPIAISKNSSNVVDDLQAEVEERASTPEGMAKLIHALLYSCSPLEQRFIRRLRAYMYTKRLYLGQRREEGQMPWPSSHWYFISRADVAEARAQYRELEIELIAAYDLAMVKGIKLEQGKHWRQPWH